MTPERAIEQNRNNFAAWREADADTSTHSCKVVEFCYALQLLQLIHRMTLSNLHGFAVRRRKLGAFLLGITGVMALLQPSSQDFLPFLRSRHLRELAAAGLKADLDVVRPNTTMLEVAIRAGDGDNKEAETFSAVNATIAIVTCACSRGMEDRTIEEMPLVELLLPSLLTTAETDRFQYNLYIGIDDDDGYWVDEEHQSYVRKVAQETSGVKVIFVEVPPEEGRQRIPFNEVCRWAYDDGADYIVRVNDDTEFISKYWTSVAIASLLSFSPPNLGVVGPICDQGNTNIMTHDMTHRTHMDVFDLNYYPPEFGNWFVDNWISTVYGSTRTAKLGNWHVHHHAEMTRYQVDASGDMSKALDGGRVNIEEWIKAARK